MTDKELMQEALKWQEHIKVLANEQAEDELYQKRSKVFDWLIEQAEKREYWMKQHRKRANELEDAYFKIQLIEKQLQQVQAKAERYEKALKEIANEQEVGEGDFDADDVANNIIATAKEALEGTE